MYNTSQTMSRLVNETVKCLIFKGNEHSDIHNTRNVTIEDLVKSISDFFHSCQIKDITEKPYYHITKVLKIF